MANLLARLWRIIRPIPQDCDIVSCKACGCASFRRDMYRDDKYGYFCTKAEAIDHHDLMNW